MVREELLPCCQRSNFVGKFTTETCNIFLGIAVRLTHRFTGPFAALLDLLRSLRVLARGIARGAEEGFKYTPEILAAAGSLLLRRGYLASDIFAFGPVAFYYRNNVKSWNNLTILNLLFEYIKAVRG